ncbi:type II secretion system F family protein [Nocardioides carbamazepini]|uniref:type II secretion system F family protein n=1 Tax=Nocardioides carbamazepini TaxID=2854259 RepID=UPI002149CCE3|nr:type II secretion system F family protein [Nocardioides carbamazepini]MCR1785034.1 type II secretion system F family protein [Nocardioides carbamazepini]
MAEAPLVALLVTAAVLLGPAPCGRRGPARAGSGRGGGPRGPAPGESDGLLRRGRLLWALLAGTGSAALVGGPLAVPAGVAVAVVVGTTAGRLEPRAVRQRREEVRRDLPHVVTLLAAALRAGQAPPEAVELVCRALPGAASARLSGAAARLRLGGDAVATWARLADDPELGPLGRALARAHRTGAPVVAAVERLADELGSRARAEVEDRARAVGVRAAVPLGVCLLPSFLLLGIVPLAVSLAGSIVGG